MGETAQTGGDDWKPRIIAFLCNWCSYAGADLAGVSRFQYPPHIKVIRVPCSGRVNPMFIVRALQSGADGVLPAAGYLEPAARGAWWCPRPGSFRHQPEHAGDPLLSHPTRRQSCDEGAQQEERGPCPSPQDSQGQCRSRACDQAEHGSCAA